MTQTRQGVENLDDSQFNIDTHSSVEIEISFEKVEVRAPVIPQ